MERNDKLLNRAFGRTKGLHNLTKWIDYDNFYTTHHHQVCKFLYDLSLSGILILIRLIAIRYVNSYALITY